MPRRSHGTTIQDPRIRSLNRREPARGRYVLYWMQQAQRASGNPALELAIAEANRRRLPVVVGFGLTDRYPEANLRHYTFMLQGLCEVADRLAERRIGFVLRRGEPDRMALDLAGDAALVVCDRGYLRHQRAWRARVAAGAPCRVVQVEGDVVVPVEVASDRAESAARTLRPKLHRVWDDFLVPLAEEEVARDGRALGLSGDVDPGDPDGTLAKLDLDRRVAPVRRFKGGTGEARRRLARFLEDKLEGYADGRSEPAAYRCSMLSPYLHFGQISLVEVALAAREARAGSARDRAGFMEELIVRREVAVNFVHYTKDYDRYSALPEWAWRTLAAHRDDRREHRYSRAELEAAATHDRYWNAAMREMVHTGYMPNHLRMYWAKRILAWSATPEAAFVTALALNNKYFLDGRDANSYANVAWVFGLHDRPWPERAVFGKVRAMTAGGLERKFDIAAYLAAVDRLVAAEEAGAQPAEAGARGSSEVPS